MIKSNCTVLSTKRLEIVSHLTVQTYFFLQESLCGTQFALLNHVPVLPKTSVSVRPQSVNVLVPLRSNLNIAKVSSPTAGEF